MRDQPRHEQSELSMGMQVNDRLARVAVVLLASTWAFVAIAVGQTAGEEPPAQTGEAAITWQSLYEPGSGGWITSFAVSPHDSRRCLIGGDMLGIAWSGDRGERWHPAFGLPTWEICDFTWHPTDPCTVWAGTFCGPALSTDGGKTWTIRRKGFPEISGGRYSEVIEKVLFDPRNAHRLIAVGGNSREWRNNGVETGLGAIYESLDDGQSWTLLMRIGPDGAAAEKGKGGGNILSAAFAAGSSDKLYATIRGGGVVASEDGGKTWQARNAGLPHKCVYRLMAHPSDPNTIWVSTGNFRPGKDKPFLPGGIYKSADGGRNWQAINSGLFQDVGDRDVFTASYKGFYVSSKNPDVMLTSDGSWNKNGLFLTRDGGRNWRYVAGRGNIGHGDHPDLTNAFPIQAAYPSGPGMTTCYIDPKDENALYAVGSEYGLRSLDGGKTWTDITAFLPDPNQPGAWRGRGYSGLCTSTFRFHPTDPKRAMLVALDAGKVWESLDGMKSWTRHGDKPWPWGGGQDGCYAGDCAYVTAGQFGGWLGVVRTTDGGRTWDTVLGASHGLPEQDKGGEPRGVYARVDEPRSVWAVVGGKLYRSTDAGEHWRGVEGSLGLAWIAGDPTKPSRFYIVGKAGAYVCEDGNTLKPIGGPRPATRGRVSCDSLGRVHVAMWRGDKQSAGLWRYADGQWQRLLDEYYTHDAAPDPANPNRIALITSDDPYHDVCSASGVWVSADDGRSWSQANDGLAMTRGNCVAFNPHESQQLVCGTWGGGYYMGRWPKGFRPAGTRSYAMTDKDRNLAESPTDAPAGGKGTTMKASTMAAAVLMAATGAAGASSQPATTSAAAYKLVVRNGGMAQGVSVPADWTGRFGDCVVYRDANTFKEAPASLCVEASGKSGQAFQAFPVKGGAKFRVAGWIKSAGKVKAQAAVQCFDEKYTRNSFIQAKYVQNDTDWTEFSKEVTIPDWAGRFNILLLVEGEGRAWLDEVREADSAVDAGKPVTAEDEMTKTAPPKDKPWTPGWGFYPQFPGAWMSMHKGFLERTKKGGIDIVFYGDSITQGWGGAGKEVWEKRYAPLKAVNYGIGGDSTRQVLWRIGHGEVDGIAPKLVVLMAGTNNLYSDYNAGSDEEIAKGIDAIVNLLREKLPATKVLLLAVLPRQNEYFCTRIRKINAIIAKLDEGKGVRFLDMTDRFQDAPGKVKADLFNKDQLHLEKKGYEVWAEAMDSVLDELMK